MSSIYTVKEISVCQRDIKCPYLPDKWCNTVGCANCKYNHVVALGSFRNQLSPTAGTVCCYEDPNNRNL